MKFKNIILIAAAVLMTVPAFAQEKKEKPQRDTRWFIGAGGGMNFGFEGESFVDRENSHIGAGTSVEAYFGKFFNNWIGFRARSITVTPTCSSGSPTGLFPTSTAVMPISTRAVQPVVSVL